MALVEIGNSLQLETPAAASVSGKQIRCLDWLAHSTGALAMPPSRALEDAGVGTHGQPTKHLPGDVDPSSACEWFSELHFRLSFAVNDKLACPLFIHQASLIRQAVASAKPKPSAGKK
jgi:hypothetical protein